MGESSRPTQIDLSKSLENLKPFPKAPPRKATISNRKRQTSAVLTGDEFFGSVEQAKRAKEAKIAAAEKRKSNADSKKKTAAEKKVTTAAKKMAKALVAKKKPEKQTTKPSRVSKRRQTIVNYYPSHSDLEEDFVD